MDGGAKPLIRRPAAATFSRKGKRTLPSTRSHRGTKHQASPPAEEGKTDFLITDKINPTSGEQRQNFSPNAAKPGPYSVDQRSMEAQARLIAWLEIRC
jgi:hypothetical protein